MAARSLDIFTDAGWSDSKHGKSGLERHSNSSIHKDSDQAVSCHRQCESGHTSELLDKATRKKLSKKRHALLGLWDASTFLGQQGLAIRSHVDECSNLTNVLGLVARHNSVLNEWLERKESHLRTWTSPDIQRSVLRSVSHGILRNILIDVKSSKHFSIIIDETSDISNDEQLALSVRYVDREFIPHEVFLGLHKCERTDAASLKSIVETSLMSLGLDLDNCIGQAYDGASAMSGAFNGLQKRFKDDNPKMLNVYCFRHQLNLVVKEVLNSLPSGVHCLSVLDSVGKFLKNSPKKKASFENFLRKFSHWPEFAKRQLVRPLCPTRWTMDKPAIDAFLGNYEEILNFLLDLSSSSEFSAKQRALASSHIKSMENFAVYYMLRVFKKVLDFVTPVHVEVQKRSLTMGKFRISRVCSK